MRQTLCYEVSRTYLLSDPHYTEATEFSSILGDLEQTPTPHRATNAYKKGRLVPVSLPCPQSGLKLPGRERMPQSFSTPTCVAARMLLGPGPSIWGDFCTPSSGEICRTASGHSSLLPIPELRLCSGCDPLLQGAPRSPRPPYLQR